MKAITIVAAAFLILPSLKAQNTAVETLIEQLKQSKSPDGVSNETAEIADKIRAIGPAAIPQVIALLKDPRESVREAAAFTLRDMKGLKEENLDVLIEVYRRDDSGWIPWDIASIDSPKAADFLIDELLRLRDTDNQIGGAIQELGERAVPPLVQVYKRDVKWDKPLEMVMFHVFRNLDSKATAAVDPLVEIISDEKSPPSLRIHVMQALAAIGPTAERAVPALEKLQKNSNSDVREGATGAILNMGVAAAAPILASELVETKDDYSRELILERIAALRERGRSVGPAVAKFLTSEDWLTRLGAARTLGYIDYREGAADLIKLLDCVEDWRIVLSAAEALGRLQFKEAVPALTKVSQDHWYPPVRAAATAAILAIRDGIHAKSENDKGNSARDFFSYEYAGYDMERLTLEEAPLIRLPIAAREDRVPKAILDREPKEHIRSRYCGTKVLNGYLLGRDKGEWGGEISLIDSHERKSTVLEGNTEAIYRTPKGIIATTGLAHGTMNSGVLYRLETDAHGRWRAKPWRALPGAPSYSRLLNDGTLFVNCYGGIVLVSPDGTMKSLTRADCGLPPADKK